MKSIDYLIILSFAIFAWVSGCDRGSNTPQNSQPKQFQDCYAITDMAQCGTAIDMKGNPLHCAPHNKDQTKCVPAALVDAAPGGCALFNGSQKIAGCNSSSVDELGNPLRCKPSLWYDATCMPEGTENAVKACTDIDLNRAGVVNPEQYCQGAGATLGLDASGNSSAGLSCAANPYANKCLDEQFKDVVLSCHNKSVVSGSSANPACEVPSEKFSLNTDGIVDYTKKEPLSCKMNIKDNSRCVMETLQNYPTTCNQFDEASCQAGAKIVNNDGTDVVDGNCTSNQYTKTCAAADATLRPEHCAMVTAMDKCEGLKLPTDSNVQELCRVDPANANVCEVAPEKQSCIYDDAVDMDQYFRPFCQLQARDNCGNFCTGGTIFNDCSPKHFKNDNLWRVKLHCETAIQGKVWEKTTNTLEKGAEDCSSIKWTVNGNHTKFCKQAP